MSDGEHKDNKLGLRWKVFRNTAIHYDSDSDDEGPEVHEEEDGDTFVVGEWKLQLVARKEYYAPAWPYTYPQV